MRLSGNDRIPVDRAGREMLFVGQLDFSEIFATVAGVMRDSSGYACAGETIYGSESPVEPAIPREGLMGLFLNRDLDFSNPKDRFSFAITWTVRQQVELSCDSLVEQPAGIALQTSDGTAGAEAMTACPPHYLFGGYTEPDWQRAREIASFSANGISWDERRRADSCYSHLVSAASQWVLLWKVGDDPLIGHALKGRDLLIVIASPDLAAGRMSSARPVVVGGI